jgi:hypothetical protein
VTVIVCRKVYVKREKFGLCEAFVVATVFFSSSSCFDVLVSEVLFMVGG